MSPSFINLNELTVIDPSHEYAPLEIEIQNMTVELMELTDRVTHMEHLLISIHETLIKHYREADSE